MNFITFIFSLLIIFSIGTFVSMEKQSGSQRLKTTYRGHVLANRKILSQVESEIYQSLRSIPTEEKKTASFPSPKEPKEITIPKINPECARLNLWPLIQEGREEHPDLYDLAIQFLGVFYGQNLLHSKPESKIHFLNDFLKHAKLAIQKNQHSLEKLLLSPPFQTLYYHMLKGTKEWDLERGVGYPSFLDVIEVEETPSKICLCHAHPGILTALFNAKVASQLYREIHEDPSLPVTRELIEKVCSESHMINVDPGLFTFLNLGRPHHNPKKKTTLVAEDSKTNVSLRKNVYRNG